MKMQETKQKANAAALLPIAVFLVLYLGNGIYFEYIHPTEGQMGFYVMSVVVAFGAALIVAFVQNRHLTFDEKIQGKIFDYSEGISPLTSLTESEETAKLLRQGTGSRFNMDTLRFVMEKSIMPRYIKGYGEINEQISIAVQSILESSSNLQMEQIIWNRKLNSYLKNLQ